MRLLTIYLSATSNRLQQNWQATQDDDIMALLKHTAKELQAYWTSKQEMTIEDEVILKVTRIVIPPSMTESTLQQLHDGYLGFTKYCNCVKQAVY